MGGRRLPRLELSDCERSELRALTSRRKTGQGVVLRARIVLTCAQGGEPGGRSPAFGRQGHSRQMAAAVPRASDRWTSRRTSLWGAPHDRGCAHRSGHHQNAREHAQGCHALEFARHGQSLGAVDFERPAYLASLRIAAAPAGDVQAVDRPRFCRQGARCRRSLCLPARARHRSMRRREVANPGPRPQPADATHTARPARAQSHDYKRHGTTSLCSQPSTSQPAR